MIYRGSLFVFLNKAFKGHRGGKKIKCPFCRIEAFLIKESKATAGRNAAGHQRLASPERLVLFLEWLERKGE